MLKLSYADCLSLSPAISVQFTLEMRVAVRNREKFTKTPYFGGSRSFKIIDVVMISSMCVPICSHFHVRRANNGIITLFKGSALFLPLVRGDPLHPVT